MHSSVTSFKFKTNIPATINWKTTVAVFLWVKVSKSKAIPVTGHEAP
jgi:hypothetical protein